MKRTFLLLVVLLFIASTYAQSVGINSDGSAPDASAMLDVKSSTKGFLPPRITLTGSTDVTTIASPATGLLIYNTATVSDVTPGYYYYNGSAWVKIGLASDASQWTTTGSDIYYNSGNVGIGTTTPVTDLEIVGNDFMLKAPSGQSSYLVVDNTDADQLSTISLRTQGGEGLAYLGLGGSNYTPFGGNNSLNIWNQSPNGPISFGTHNGTATAERVRIDKDGNVGIGTTSPGAKLDVYGSGQRMRIGDGTNTIVTGQWDGVTNRIESSGRQLFLTSYDGGLAFGIDGNKQVTINTAGNVGIGTNSPSVPLHVYGTGTTGWVGRGAFGGENVAVVMGEYSGSAYLGAHNAALTGWADLIINEGGGKVCIGTTTPQARLTIGGFGHGVLGGITMTPDNDTEGGHYMTFTNHGYTANVGSIARGPGNTVLYNTSSDYRLKENVVNIDIDQAKSRLMSLRPVEYNYISDENKTVISGFLAHEMADAGFANGVTGEKDAVDKDGKPIYQAIDTKFLIPEMVKVIQEQQTEIEALKAENANLKAENSSIKSDVEALKNVVFGTAQLKQQ